jgi:hypothetical protein
MNERDFVYWLNGLMELGEPETLNAKQVQMIKDHLKYVFTHMEEQRQTTKVTLDASAPDVPSLLDHVARYTGGGTLIC